MGGGLFVPKPPLAPKPPRAGARPPLDIAQRLILQQLEYKDAVFISRFQLRRDQTVEKPQLTRPRLLPLDQHPLTTSFCPLKSHSHPKPTLLSRLL